MEDRDNKLRRAESRITGLFLNGRRHDVAFGLKTQATRRNSTSVAPTMKRWIRSKAALSGWRALRSESPSALRYLR